MIGLFAIRADRVYFNEMLFKSNLQACEFPLENWFLPKRKELFIPLSAGAVTVLDMLQDEKFTPDPCVLTPTLAGILVLPTTKVYEVGLDGTGKVGMRRVPVVLPDHKAIQGVRYVRAQTRDLEEAYTAALRITDDLAKANDLTRKATLSLPGRPVYTSLAQLAWGALTQDVDFIRAKMTHQQVQTHVRKAMPAMVAKVQKEKSNASA